MALLLLAACKPKVPSQVIQPDEMEDVLYDYYLAQGMSLPTAQESGDYNEEYNRQLVLKKYGYSQADFDSSMVWYYNHLEDLYKIYERVQHRLSEDALAQGTSVRELQQFTKTYSLNSDTTDVWEGKRCCIPRPRSMSISSSRKPTRPIMLAIVSSLPITATSWYRVVHVMQMCFSR